MIEYCPTCGSVKYEASMLYMDPNKRYQHCFCNIRKAAQEARTMEQTSNEETGITANAILNNLISFMEQLAASGMDHKDIVSRGYDFALAKLRSKADMELRQGSEISATMLTQIMDHAADLLKAAVGRGIEVQPSESRNILGTGRVEKWKCSETIPEPPLEAEILHNGKYYKGTLDFDREDK